VASTADNEIFAIPDRVHRSTTAGTGFVVFDDPTHLHGPLGLTLTPNGRLIAANGDGVNAGGTQNDLVEFTEDGDLVATYQLDGGILARRSVSPALSSRAPSVLPPWMMI
jgi:hypothetical protein